MGPSDDAAPLAAGRVGPWLDGMGAALAGTAASDVQCGSCTACCRSSQFVPVGPDELDALDHIPSALLFPAPRRPGHQVMGYDEHGHCPMLVDDACSIYEHRPRACRTYDCRVFAAADVEPDRTTQPEVATRVGRWRFEVAEEADRVHLEAVRAASRYVRDRSAELPRELAPTTPVQHAVLAVRLHRAFVESASDEPDETIMAELVADLAPD